MLHPKGFVADRPRVHALFLINALLSLLHGAIAKHGGFLKGLFAIHKGKSVEALRVNRLLSMLDLFGLWAFVLLAFDLFPSMGSSLLSLSGPCSLVRYAIY